MSTKAWLIKLLGWFFKQSSVFDKLKHRKWYWLHPFWDAKYVHNATEDNTTSVMLICHKQSFPVKKPQ